MLPSLGTESEDRQMKTGLFKSLGSIHRYSWISLLVCWVIWIINAYDREIILRLGPSISESFDLSPDTWGIIASLIMLSLAIMPIPGSALSDKYGGGGERAKSSSASRDRHGRLVFYLGAKAHQQQYCVVFGAEVWSQPWCRLG